MPESDVVQLRAAGVSFVVELTEPVPRVLHWGEDLGNLSAAGCDALCRTAEPAVLNNAIDTPRRFTIWPTEGEGWPGTPAQQGHVDGAATSPRPHLTGARQRPLRDGGSELTVALADDVSRLDIEVTYQLTAAGMLGVSAALTRRHAVGGSPRSHGSGDEDRPYSLANVCTLLPLPGRATEVLDCTGKWCRERAPQRRPLTFGGYVREVRRGRPGHDSPYVLVAGVPGFGFRTGEVWGLHVAWSGNQRYLIERLPEGAGAHAAVLGGGELLAPGEVLLGSGQTYQTPVCYFGWSDQGLDGLAHRFHAMLRARPEHPSTPRPLMLNTWEAVYLNHDPHQLIALTDRAAQIGVERLVLDDGWFLGRHSDRAGLGDWIVDEELWPDGLTPLAEHVHGLGMQFGLWIEPEMVNLESTLARRHPEWILGPSAGLGPSARHQYAVNLADDEAWTYLLKSIDALVTRYRIDYLKWDHNRDLYEAVRRGADGRDLPGVHAQTLALYRLLDTLKARHPGLEIETCAGGGGRIDLAILRRTDRVWASDCNDPVERQAIQRWTGQLLPPELIGSHVGASRAHTTQRVTSQSFRLATALFGHAGIEQDLTRCSAEELRTLAAWARMYREFRPMLHRGDVVRADVGDDATMLHGVVSSDGAAALFCWVRLATSAAGQSGRERLPGLAVDRDYQVRVRTDAGSPAMHQAAPPAWVERAVDGWVDIPGAVLAVAGLPMPTLAPQQAMLIEVRAAPYP